MKQIIPDNLSFTEVGHLPIMGSPQDGNASDKTLNNELLTNISKHMASHGLQPGAFVYVADSAFVTKDNLEKASAHDKRRHKRIDRLLVKKHKDVDALCKKIRSATYYCRADAEAAITKLQAAAKGSYHKVACAINCRMVARFADRLRLARKP